MSDIRQIKLLNARAALLKEYREKKARYDEVYASASSASLSSNGGSKTFSNHSLDAMLSELERIKRDIRNVNQQLAGGGLNGGIRHVVTVRG